MTYNFIFVDMLVGELDKVLMMQEYNTFASLSIGNVNCATTSRSIDHDKATNSRSTAGEVSENRNKCRSS